MKNPRTVASASIFAVCVIVAGCMSATDELEASGARPLGADEAVAQVSGNTEIWTKGGGYYAEDGTLIALWEGQSYQGTWEVRENGELCYTVTAWGDTDCQSYFERDGEILLAYDGGSRPVEYLPGNQLASL